MTISRTTLSRRFASRRATPKLVALHRSLTRLKSTVTVLHTGAHPDDEQNGMLALMRFGRGFRTIIGCSTRGEGGQNSLGPERGAALGVVRTRELEQAARTIDADIVWLGFGPDDPVHDFGFSKNGHDTLSRWTHDLIVERLVRAYRTEKPDIVIPTFLDVPGQHGHHRAMTMAAEEAIALAASPDAFPEHFSQGLASWKVTKYYLPAWSGGGSTYDDEVPPPPETVRLTAPGLDPATGASFAEIGEWSRFDHASQGMGRWDQIGQTEWPLHLKIGPRGESDIGDGLPRRLADIDPALAKADDAIAEAIAAFPDIDAILPLLARAADSVAAAQAPAEHAHRLVQMLADIEHTMRVAAGIDCLAALDRPILPQGDDCMLEIDLFGVPEDTPVSLELPPGITATPVSPRSYRLTAAPDAPLSAPFVRFHSGSGPSGGVRITLEVTIAGRTITSMWGLESPLRIVPAVSVVLSPDAVLVPADAAFSDIAIEYRRQGEQHEVSLAGCAGISVKPKGGGFRLASVVLPEGRHELTAHVGTSPAFASTLISYPHIGESVYLAPARLNLLALDLKLPADRRVAYLGGGADNTAKWLRRMGFEVTELDPRDLSHDLSHLPTIVVGIFAFGLRPDLISRTGALHAYVESGGNLVTLYHRPWDGWDPDRVPPRTLKIGQPSLRWRVTDPQAPVQILAPTHPLLTGPNAISDTDFSGWNKERGLYFAAEWDEAYIPLLAMSDTGEAPLKGSLLSAQIGKGRHTHTSLVLHHQLDHLVPGAFRLVANLVAGGRM